MKSIEVLLLLIGASLIKAQDPMGIFEEAMMECLQKNNMTQREFEAEWENSRGTPTENFLCANKCYAEHLEVLNCDGTINIDNLDKVPFGQQIPELKVCISKIETIASCQDMTRMLECVAAIR